MLAHPHPGFTPHQWPAESRPAGEGVKVHLLRRQHLGEAELYVAGGGVGVTTGGSTDCTGLAISERRIATNS